MAPAGWWSTEIKFIDERTESHWFLLTLNSKFQNIRQCLGERNTYMPLQHGRRVLLHLQRILIHFECFLDVVQFLWEASWGSGGKAYLSTCPSVHFSWVTIRVCVCVCVWIVHLESNCKAFYPLRYKSATYAESFYHLSDPPNKCPVHIKYKLGLHCWFQMHSLNQCSICIQFHICIVTPHWLGYLAEFFLIKVNILVKILS